MLAEPIELSAILVNYNTREMTLDCVRRLLDEMEGISSEVLVVDNASTDGSAQAIAAAFPQIILLQSDRNLGFGGGNNLALARANGRYLLLINTDAFVRPGAVRGLINYLDLHPEVALAGPRLLNADGSLQRSCYRFPSPLRAWAESVWFAGLFGGDHPWGDYRRWPHDKEQYVDWVIGACCIVRREVVTKVGGFDERFFMYAEETDWQRRIVEQGWRIGFTPASEVMHLGGASGETAKTSINPEFFQSQDLYELKHHGAIGLLLWRVAVVTGCILRLPCWLLLSIVHPRYKSRAKDKMLFAYRLLMRQLTNWTIFTTAGDL